MGSMIGSGIFLAPALIAAIIVADDLGPGTFVSIWAIGGVLTLCGALSYGELAAAFPHAGGQYVFLKEAYSPFPAFLYGWTIFLVVLAMVVAATLASALAWSGVALIAFVPFIGLAVVPLQLFALLLRGVLFEYIALAARSAPTESFTTTIVLPSPRLSSASRRRAKSSGQSAPAMLNAPARRSGASAPAIPSALHTALSSSRRGTSGSGLV